MSTADFASRWSAFALAWHESGREESLIRDVLDRGADALPEPDDRRVPQRLLLACDAALIRASATFDESGYKAAFPEVEYTRGTGPIRHFCRIGWRELRPPNADFDVWWYVTQYLDPVRTDVDPYVHYLVHRRPGVAPFPTPAPAVRSTTDRTASGAVRRACLLAGFDSAGRADDNLVRYATELGRFADVHFCSSVSMPPDDLARMTAVTTGAWSTDDIRSRRGPWARLVRDLVGWEQLAGYDELLLADDSAVLLRPLDDVFRSLESTSTPLWGLQASKRDFDPDRGHVESISVDAAAGLDADAARWDPRLRLHLRSSFLAVRGDALADPAFRRTVEATPRTTDLDRDEVRTDVALSDQLIRRGYAWSTWSGELEPFDPLYTPQARALVRRGFPLLPRDVLAPRPGPQLSADAWRKELETLLPDAPVDSILKGLHPSTSPSNPGGHWSEVRPWTAEEFVAEDLRAPKYDHWWAFPVCAYDHTFAGNERAVFEHVKDDPSIKKIVLTRDRPIRVDGENVVVLPLHSREGQWHVARARTIFLKHGAHVNLPYPVAGGTHNLINLWHGIPIKRFGIAGASLASQNPEAILDTHARCRAVICGSQMDRLAMTSAFFPVPYADMWVTGLPRNDVILQPADQMRPAQARAVADLTAELDGRRLVMFLPTFKDGQADSYYRFAPDEIEALARWQQQHNAVIGIREHMADTAGTYHEQLRALDPIDLSSGRFAEVEPLYRVADALVTDYSSCVVDFMLTGKPVISFAYDLDRYSHQERGLFYDLEKVLPGPVCRTFAEFEEALADVFEPRSPEEADEYVWRRRIFHDHVDHHSTQRVVEQVKELLWLDAHPWERQA